MAEVPFTEDDDGRVVFDLDAYKAAEREGKPDQYVKFNGVEFRLPNAADIPLEITEMLERGELYGALKGMFGDEYRTVMDAGLSLGDLQVVVALIMGSRSVDVLGELQASNI